jgi:copper transport protein
MRLFFLLGACLVTVIVAFFPPSPALSHAAMVKSSPINGASLKLSPPVIRAWFSEALAKGSSLRLVDVHQKVLASGGLDTNVPNHTVLKIVPPHLGPGAYAVRWYAISADDGATKRGSFGFSVTMAAMTPGDPDGSRLPLSLIAEASTMTYAILRLW